MKLFPAFAFALLASTTLLAGQFISGDNLTGVTSPGGSCTPSPCIASQNGSTIEDGESITITGLGFGSKSPAAPMIWDDGGTSSATSPFSKGYVTVWTHPDDIDGSQSGYGAPAYCDQVYRTQAEVVALGSAAAGVAMPHSHMSRYLTSAHCDDDALFAASGVVVPFGGQSLPFNVYTSVYERYDPNWCFNSPTCPEVDNNFKNFTWASALRNTAPGAGYWYLVSNTGAGTWDWNSNHFGGAGFGTNPFANWRQVEMVFRVARSGGTFDLWDNGTQYFDLSGADTSQGDGATGTGCTDYGVSSPCFGWWIGGYYRPVGLTTQRKYFGDIYVDRTWARVVLGNASTYAASTRRELQPPTAWSSTSVTVTANLGSCSSQTCYLYVCDSTNTCTPGFAVTVGS